MKPAPRPAPNPSPLTGPGLSRRGFLELSAGGLVASWFLRSPAAAWAATTAPGATPRGTARNAILVFLPGAISQTDTWDLKEGGWTPPALAPADAGAGVRFPQGLMPRMFDRLGEVSIVRSYMAWALVHGLAQTWVQISRNPTGALGSVAPHVGSVVALEMEARRDPGRDVLPSFVALSSPGLVGSGYFPSTFAPFSVTPTASGLPSLSHPDGAGRLALRWHDLETLDARLRSGDPLGKEVADMAGFYRQAKALVDAPEVNALFSYSEEAHERYGGTGFGAACLVARQLLSGRRGTRFVQVSMGGWDMHSNVYATGGTSLLTLCPQLDAGLGALLDDLAAAPGEEAGKSLLDETLVLVASEFGRTVGPLNGQQGRDHFLRTSVVLFGGGIRRGHVLGATDATGANLADPGWSGGREVRPEDVACTLYSALGIDWTTVRHDDPVGRGFEYVPYAREGVYRPVEELFG